MTIKLIGSNNFKYSDSHIVCEVSAVWVPFRTCSVSTSEETVKYVYFLIIYFSIKKVCSLYPVFSIKNAWVYIYICE